jgi:phosphoribulokinase
MPIIATRLLGRRKPAPRPLMLGVVGDSGCGKSTFVLGLHHLFGKNRVTEICLDDYHRYDRAERARRNISALDPAANDLDKMVEDLTLLRTGKRIRKPVYDHATGKFAHPETITPRPVIIVHGLFTLFSPEMAELFDLGLYLDPEEGLRQAWKIARDTGKRGYSREEVLQQIADRQPDAENYIHPQKKVADLIVSFRRPISLLGNSELDVKLTPCESWEWPRLQPEGAARWLIIPPGRPLEISGQIDLFSAEHIARAFVRSQSPLFPNLLNEQRPLQGLGLYQPGGAKQPQKQSLPLALTQLLVAGRLVESGVETTEPIAA